MNVLHETIDVKRALLIASGHCEGWAILRLCKDFRTRRLRALTFARPYAICLDVSWYNAECVGFGKTTTIDVEKKLIDYLNTSPFSSVYGAKNWADDYAETFMYCYLKEKFNIEYELP